jgi:hypothetical protein
MTTKVRNLRIIWRRIVDFGGIFIGHVILSEAKDLSDEILRRLRGSG